MPPLQCEVLASPGPPAPRVEADGCVDIRHLQWLMGKLRFGWRNLITSQQEHCALLGKVVLPARCPPRGSCPPVLQDVTLPLPAASLAPLPARGLPSEAQRELGPGLWLDVGLPRPGRGLTGWVLPWGHLGPDPGAPGGPRGGLGQMELGITGAGSQRGKEPARLAFQSPEVPIGPRLCVTEQ